MSNNYARVFISCGQSSQSELKIAHRIKEGLGKFGFNEDLIYIALEEQTLKGIKENIFRQLSESEYLIFIDFKREKIIKEKKNHLDNIYRGSLFSHQELALATFLNIESVLFIEKNVEIEGILKYVQGNPISFVKRESLPDKVIKQIKQRKWNPNWRNELVLERGDKDFEEVTHVGSKYKPSRFYHIKVKNLHQSKIACDCLVYLMSIKNLLTQEVKIPELVELKWKGVTTSRVSIPPKHPRFFDAFNISRDSLNVVHLGINPFIVDYTGYINQYTLGASSDYELTYIVFSDNFPPVKATFKLHVGNRLEDIDFRKIETQELEMAL